MLVTASAAAAAAGRAIDSSGNVWRTTINAHGAVLRSHGATIYLGRDCEVRSPQLGHGRWQWANGGFLIVLRDRRIGFPRQEIAADPDGRCHS